MSILTRNKSVSADDLGNIADHAAQTASNAIRSTQSVANAAFDRMDSKVEGARQQASPVINHWSEQAETALRRSLEAVRETSAQLRRQAAMASDATAGRVRDEPLKAVLIAAAAGAVLMGLISLVSRKRSRDAL